MLEKHISRQRFIEEFVKAIISVTPHPDVKESKPETTEKTVREVPQRVQYQTTSTPPKIHHPVSQQINKKPTPVSQNMMRRPFQQNPILHRLQTHISPVTQMKQPPAIRPQQNNMIASPKITPRNIPFRPARMAQAPPSNKQPITPQEENSIFGKLAKVLRDPAVQSVECKGPGKSILVNSSGRIQTTQIRLTKAEIDNIIERTSKETGIPAIQGIFKVLLGEFSLTAVISDYIGTRFIIQKRSPFNR